MKKITKFIMGLSILITLSVLIHTSAFAYLNYNEPYSSPGGERKILIIIASDIIEPLYNSMEFQQWKLDLEKENYKLQMTVISSGTAAELRDFIKNYYNTYNIDGLEGVIMIGDLPYATYEGNFFGGMIAEQFPVDLFFMDLDGTWQDTNNNGYYDTHLGNKSPEIWLGRIKTSNLNYDSSRDEVGKLRFYFNKVHLYKQGILSLNKRALSYNDDDWNFFGDNNLSSIYQDVRVIQDNYTTSAPDYMNRLRENYEWIHVSAHSTQVYHRFLSGGTSSYVWYFDLIPIEPLASFYNLFACSSADYTYDNYIAGHYIFNRRYGLAAIGSTKAGSMLDNDRFYPNLGPFGKKSIGEAFKNWFISEDLSSDFGVSWFYGMTIIGDPTLTITPRNQIM